MERQSKRPVSHGRRAESIKSGQDRAKQFQPLGDLENPFLHRIGLMSVSRQHFLALDQSTNRNADRASNGRSRGCRFLEKKTVRNFLKIPVRRWVNEGQQRGGAQ
jgi:hypothetical protein